MKSSLSMLVLFAIAGCSGGDSDSSADSGVQADATATTFDASPPPDAALPPDACVPRAWFPDCDGDGKAAATAEPTSSCIRPSQAPASCPNQTLAEWTLTSPSGLLSSDCDDDNDQVGVAVSYYVDCDGDGFAPSTAGSVTACEEPALSDLCSDLSGTWTELQPIDSPYSDVNATTDCVDADDQVYPEQAAWFSVEIAGAEVGREFDYNCDGSTIKRYGSNYSCSVTPFGDGFACTHTPGYATSTGCGAEGTYRTGCTTPGGGSCSFASTTPRVQECH